MIDLCKNGNKYKFLVHRLVALNFVPNPNNYPIVLHIDNIKTNTHYTNLKWGTYSENNKQAIHDGLNTVPRPDNRIYYEIRNNSEFVNCAYGIDEVKEITKYNKSIRGLYSLIFRGSVLKDGPYKGCNIIQSNMKPAVYFY